MEEFTPSGLSLAELEELLRLAMYELVEIQKLPLDVIDMLVPCSVWVNRAGEVAVMYFAHRDALDMPITFCGVPRSFLQYLVATHEGVHHASA